jgi:3-methyladenine DNA glycosylase/8-oxoguanine DNA glycosylase
MEATDPPPATSRARVVTSFARQDARVHPASDDVAGWALGTQAPFHLEATVRVLQRRPANLVDHWEQDRYLRVLTTADRLALVEVQNRGAIDAPDIRVSVRSGSPSGATRLELERTIRKVLGLDVDPDLLQGVAKIERRLRPTALALRGMRPPRFAGLFEAFANVVPFQQLSLDAGVAVVGRLVERFGRYIEQGGRRLHAFPTARAVAEAPLAALRRCGLSSHKAESLRYLAGEIASGRLTEDQLSRMGSTEALQLLAELPGIGPWSAGLVLLRGLGRLDVFPAGDVGAARGLGALLRLRPGAALDPIVERVGDHRGYLYFCALGGSLLARGLIHAAPPRPSLPEPGRPTRRSTSRRSHRRPGPR